MEEAEKRHYAVIDPYKRLLTIKVGDEVVAKTTEALILKEVGKSVYDPVFYIPKKDLKTDLKKETNRNSYCPIKGDATYWQLETPTDNYFAWSYESPLPRASKIEGYIAFNKDYVTIISDPVE